MASGSVSERPVVISELLPEDLKLEMEQFSRSEASAAARYLASIVGKAHGRQMSSDDRHAWTASYMNASPSIAEVVMAVVCGCQLARST